MSDTNRIHKCHCCGWEWVHGQHGGHDCSIKLQERIKELEGQLEWSIGQFQAIRLYNKSDGAIAAACAEAETRLMDK